jgi:hypothetical protein
MRREKLELTKTYHDNSEYSFSLRAFFRKRSNIETFRNIFDKSSKKFRTTYGWNNVSFSNLEQTRSGRTRMTLKIKCGNPMEHESLMKGLSEVYDNLIENLD